MCAEPQKQIPFWRPQQLKPRLGLSHADESVLKAAGWGAQGPGSWDPDFLASEEDKLIVEARRMGMEWQAIAKHLPDRTVASMRKQFGNAKIRPRVGEPRLIVAHSAAGLGGAWLKFQHSGHHVQAIRQSLIRP